MEVYIVTIIQNRGEPLPDEEKIEEAIKELVYDNEVYVKKIK